MAAHAEAVSRNTDDASITEPTAWLANQLGLYWYARGQFRVAEPLMRRALAINEGRHGPDHPEVASRVRNLAQLLYVTSRLSEAEPLMLQVVRIRIEYQRRTGHEDPNLRVGVDNYVGLLRAMARTKKQIQHQLRELDESLGSEGS